jgi:Resolvase, N terminal domain
MLIGYARVSTDDQNLDLQRDALNTAGCGKIYEDCISGAKVARPGLAVALEVACSGDVLVVWRLDRLGPIPARFDCPGQAAWRAGIGLIEQHLTLAPETGHQASEKPITEAIAASLLSKQIDDL